jgi:tetratricopeptide (TPR) repeat protein
VSKAVTFILTHKLWLVIIIVVLLMVLTAPGVAAVYHQVRGGLLLDRVIADQPENARTYFPCSQLSLQNPNQVDTLRESIQHLLKANSSMLTKQRVSLLLARSYCFLDGPQAAIPLYQEAIRLQPGDPLRHLELAMAFDELAWKMGNDPDLNNFETVSEWLNAPLPAAEALIQQALSEWNASGVTNYQLILAGDEQLATGDYQGAVKWYVRANWLEQGGASIWRKVGDVFKAQGKWQEAASAYHKAWLTDPENTVIDLASALGNEKDFLGADEILKQALQTFPSSPYRVQWIRLLGASLVKQEKWEKAQTLYTQAIKEFPDQGEFYISLGWVIYEYLDDIQYARYLFEQAVALNPERAAGYAAIGQLLSREKLFGEADKWLAQAIEKDPKQSYYYLLRANNARNADRVSEAIELYKQTIVLFPDYPIVYYQLAQAYKINHQVQEAVDAIERAIEINPKPEVAYYLRAAQIYQWAGDDESAIRTYEKVIELDPQNQEAQQALETFK